MEQQLNQEKKGQLFTLVAFRDRKNLVNEDEIWNYYKLKIKDEINPLIQPPPPKPKPVKQKVDLKPANALIYTNLIKTGRELITQTELMNYLLNIDSPYASEYNKLYTQYKKDYNKYHKHDPVLPSVSPDMTLPYPFRSKRKEYETNRFKGIINEGVKMTNEKNDKNSKRLKSELSRPSFAIEPYSWEIDHLQFNKERITYLFCLNVNTRYLYVIPVNNKSTQETKVALDMLIEKEMNNFGHVVKNIRGDGDKGFESVKAYYPNINFYFTGSKFTYHNKLIDACMKTLRNALNNDSLWDGQHDDIIQQLVYYYNFTKHRATGMKPIDMHSSIDKEWEYIRQKTEELNDTKRKQFGYGLYTYKPGDKLRIHLEYAKTSDRFMKRRRQFDTEGVFISYVGGNVRVRLENGNIIDVPIYFTLRK